MTVCVEADPASSIMVIRFICNDFRPFLPKSAIFYRSWDLQLFRHVYIIIIIIMSCVLNFSNLSVAGETAHSAEFFCVRIRVAWFVRCVYLLSVACVLRDSNNNMNNNGYCDDIYCCIILRSLNSGNWTRFRQCIKTPRPGLPYTYAYHSTWKTLFIASTCHSKLVSKTMTETRTPI